MNTKEDILFRKMALLKEAVEEVNRQDEAMDELRAAAFEALLLNPGCDYKRWGSILAQQYGTELMDALSPRNAEEALEGMRKLWQSAYKDKSSGLEYTYSTWAAVFATEQSVQMYYDMIKKKNM